MSGILFTMNWAELADSLLVVQVPVQNHDDNYKDNGISVEMITDLTFMQCMGGVCVYTFFPYCLLCAVV